MWSTILLIVLVAAVAGITLYAFILVLFSKTDLEKNKGGATESAKGKSAANHSRKNRQFGTGSANKASG